MSLLYVNVCKCQDPDLTPGAGPMAFFDFQVTVWHCREGRREDAHAMLAGCCPSCATIQASADAVPQAGPKQVPMWKDTEELAVQVTSVAPSCVLADARLTQCETIVRRFETSL